MTVQDTAAAAVPGPPSGTIAISQDAPDPSAAIRSHIEIADAAPVDFGAGRIAWLVTRQGYVSGPAVRTIVMSALEDNDIPLDGLHVIIVGGIPRAEDGEVDVPAARAEGWRSPWTYEWEPPQTAHEIQLAAIFGELIPDVSISMTDDLTSLGGDSLLAAELVEVIEERTGRPVSASDLFAATSLREICRLILDEANLG